MSMGEKKNRYFQTLEERMAELRSSANSILVSNFSPPFVLVRGFRFQRALAVETEMEAAFKVPPVIFLATFFVFIRG